MLTRSQQIEEQQEDIEIIKNSEESWKAKTQIKSNNINNKLSIMWTYDDKHKNQNHMRSNINNSENKMLEFRPQHKNLKTK